MNAKGISCAPDLLIADEPTTALDVTIQAQILKLIGQLQADIGMSVILITHNLGVVATMAARLVIMYAGRVVEQGSVDDIFVDHQHPYTHGLLRSVPRLDRPTEDLLEIKGIVPRLDDLPAGCAFSTRCDHVMDKCRQLEPELKEIGPGHSSRCWLENTPW